jgi:hypothetical protein
MPPTSLLSSTCHCHIAASDFLSRLHARTLALVVAVVHTHTLVVTRGKSSTRASLISHVLFERQRDLNALQTKTRRGSHLNAHARISLLPPRARTTKIDERSSTAAAPSGCRNLRRWRHRHGASASDAVASAPSHCRDLIS